MKNCGNCQFTTYAGDGEFTCDNEESENYGLECDYDGLCDEYEEKEVRDADN